MRYCVNGNHRRAVLPDRALFADTARQCAPVQFAGVERHLVRYRTGLQMARSAQAVRQLAHHLYPNESVVEERRAGSGLRTVATRSDRPHQDRSRCLGQYRCQGPSRRHRGSKKNGPQAIGKSRGGWTTKIHMVAADARTAITFALSPGHAHDAPEGRKLLRHLARHHGRSISSWTAHTKVTRRGSSRLISGLSPSYHPSKTGSPRGNTTAP